MLHAQLPATMKHCAPKAEVVSSNLAGRASEEGLVAEARTQLPHSYQAFRLSQSFIRALAVRAEETRTVAGEDARTIMRRIANDYDRLAKLAEEQFRKRLNEQLRSDWTRRIIRCAIREVAPGGDGPAYTTRRRQLSSITRAPCRKVMGVCRANVHRRRGRWRAQLGNPRRRRRARRCSRHWQSTYRRGK